MKADDFVSAARKLAKSPPKRPNQVFLRRGISSCYYSLFHELCGLCADIIIGSTTELRETNEWRHAYGALDHGKTKSRLYKFQSAEGKKHFQMPESVLNFSQKFVNLQMLRHQADYDPHYKINKSNLQKNIDDTAEAIKSLRNIDTRDKRALASYILFDERPHSRERKDYTGGE